MDLCWMPNRLFSNIFFWIIDGEIATTVFPYITLKLSLTLFSVLFFLIWGLHAYLLPIMIIKYFLPNLQCGWDFLFFSFLVHFPLWCFGFYTNFMLYSPLTFLIFLLFEKEAELRNVKNSQYIHITKKRKNVAKTEH